MWPVGQRMKARVTHWLVLVKHVHNEEKSNLDPPRAADENMKVNITLCCGVCLAGCVFVFMPLQV